MTSSSAEVLKKVLQREASSIEAGVFDPVESVKCMREAAGLIETLTIQLQQKCSLCDPTLAYGNGYAAGQMDAYREQSKEAAYYRQIRNSFRHKIKKYRRDAERYKKEANSAKSLLDRIYSETKLAVELDFRPYGDWFVKVIDEWRGIDGNT